MKNRFLKILPAAGAAAVLICGFAFADDVEVRARVDKSAVGLNQQFTLSVEISGKDARTAEPQPPDIGEFAHFLGSGSSQNIQVVNGAMTVSRTVSYHYQASKTGSHRIPKIKVLAGGRTFESEAVAIEITSVPAASRSGGQTAAPASSDGAIAAEDLFLKVSAHKKEVFQNEPVILTYTIYTRVNVTSFEYTRNPETAGFWVEDYFAGRQPQTSSEIVDGRQYTTAVLKKMALFPMSSGVKEIAPMEITCNITVRSRSRDIFDDFFSSGFGRTVKKAVVSKPVTVTVKPLPQEGRPHDFNGVVGRYRLKSSVDKTSVKTNDALTYRLTVSGTGNIKAIPEPGVVFPGDFEVYPPDISENVEKQANSISGSRTFEWVMVPRTAGTYSIPPVKLPVFDPFEKKYTLLTSDPIAIEVEQGSGPVISAPAGLSKEEVRLLGQDIRFIKTDTDPFVPVARGTAPGLLFWLVLILPLPALAAALGYSRFRGRLESDIAWARNRRAGKTAKKRLAAAGHYLSHGDQQRFYAETGRAIMNFLGDKLNIPAASIMTDEVKKLLRARDVSSKTVDAVVSCLAVCDRQRFAPASVDADEMRSFYTQCAAAVDDLNRELS